MDPLMIIWIVGALATIAFMGVFSGPDVNFFGILIAGIFWPFLLFSVFLIVVFFMALLPFIIIAGLTKMLFEKMKSE